MSEKPYGLEYLEEVEPYDLSIISGLYVYGSSGGGGTTITSTTGPTTIIKTNDGDGSDGGDGPSSD